MHYIYAMQDKTPIELIEEKDMNGWDEELIQLYVNAWYWRYFKHYKGGGTGIRATKEKLL